MSTPSLVVGLDIAVDARGHRYRIAGLCPKSGAKPAGVMGASLHAGPPRRVGRAFAGGFGAKPLCEVMGLARTAPFHEVNSGEPPSTRGRRGAPPKPCRKGFEAKPLRRRTSKKRTLDLALRAVAPITPAKHEGSGQ